MATIVHSRNISVGSTSGTATGRITATAITISATALAFTKAKNVAAASSTPASITFSTTKVGFSTPTMTWSYATSSAPDTFTTITTGTSYVLSNSTFLTHRGSASFVRSKCTVTEAGWATASTTVDIAYNAQNNDVPVANLSKSAIVLPTTATGTVDYANSSCRVTVSIGGTNIPYNASAVANSYSLSVATSTGTITTGVGGSSITTTSVANDTVNLGNLSGMTTEAAVIRYTINARDADNVATVIIVDQSISKATSGSTGYTTSITGGTRSVTYDATGANPAPASTAFTAVIQQNGAAITPLSYSWSATGIYSGTSTSSTFTPTLATSHTTTASTVSCVIVPASGVASITETVHVAVSRTGATGTPGSTGSTGSTGQSNHRVYIAAAIASPPATPSTTTSGATPAGWSATPVSPTTGQAQFQSDGTTPAGSTTTTWATPYQSFLKVGSLEAIVVDTGSLNVTGALTVGTAGHVKGGQTAYNTGTGFFLGYASAAYKLSIGTSSNGMTWDGSALTINGGGLVAGSYKTATGSGQRIEIVSTTPSLIVYNSSNQAILTVGPGAGSGGIVSELYNYTATTSNYWFSSTKAIGFDIESTNRFIVGNHTNSTTTITSKTIPGADNTYDFGTSGLRWKDMHCMSLTQHSDSRLKTNISTSDLGLNFINKLRPVSYTWISGTRYETGEFTETVVNTAEGIEKVEKTPVYAEIPGVRKHYGLIAQEVKAALDELNTGDFAGFVLEDKDDPNSRHSLRYLQFISPLIKAVQELSARVVELENRLNDRTV